MDESLEDIKAKGNKNSRTNSSQDEDEGMEASIVWNELQIVESVAVSTAPCKQCWNAYCFFALWSFSSSCLDGLINRLISSHNR